MKISTKFNIMSALSIAAVLIIGVMLILISKHMERESAEAAIAEEIVEDIGELRNLAFEYFLFQKNRAKEQWQIKYSHTSEHFRKELFYYPEERAVVEKMNEEFKTVGSLFSRIVVLREKTKTRGEREIALMREQESFLINSFLVKSMTVANEFRALAKMIRDEEKRHHERFHLLIVISISIIAAGILMISIVLRRRITGPIARLHEGTEIIGSGNLDYKIGIETGDEIGGLAGAFDRMTENLMSVTTSRNELELILRTSMDGYFVSDAKGLILYANDSYCRITGYSREELMNMTISDIEAVEMPDETAKHVERVMKEGSDLFETRHRCKDGRIIDVEISVNFMNIKGGRFFAFLRDITERKKWENKLRQLNKELEIRLSEIKTLRGLLPICSYCKKIRDDKGYWQQMELYIHDHSEAEFSHGMCPACAEKASSEWKEFRKRGRES